MNEITLSEYKKKPKRNKYGAVKTTYNGVKYDSKKEAQFAQELDLRLKAGGIIRWCRQVKYPITVNDIKICDYKLDFKVVHSNPITVKNKKHTYITLNEYIDIKAFDKKTGKFLVTPLSKLKMKLVEAQYGIKIILK